MTRSCEVRKLGINDVQLIAEIDRSEQVEFEYAVTEGRLVKRPVSMSVLPPWDPVGAGPYSVAARIAFCQPLVAGGAVLLGAFDGESLCGVAVIHGAFEPPLAWLAFLHVTRAHRRKGVASALWSAAEQVAVDAGAESMYVSSVSTGSAVGFYRNRGCELADPVHPHLYAMEPDDIHFVKVLQ
ncbi:MAG: GNAT family N-acetyltransferase [Actinomycetota bacterium]|nr:GNAT family N-acetyltransferase [Actinomycetota bacterium]